MKDGWVMATSFAMLVAVALTGSCSSSKRDTENGGQIPLTNGGFEDNVAVPWNPFRSVRARVSNDHVHSGKFGLAQDSGSGSLYQDVKGLEIGATYEVSAYVSSTPDATAPAQLVISDPEGTVPAFSKLIAARPEWQLVAQSVSAIAPGIIRIQLCRYEGSGTIYWDDVQIRRK